MSRTQRIAEGTPPIKGILFHPSKISGVQRGTSSRNNRGDMYNHEMHQKEITEHTCSIKTKEVAAGNWGPPPQSPAS